jgi:NAD(P)-dependent dehydrogenase (short-subunit alcohol dehydrogenase family)
MSTDGTVYFVTGTTQGIGYEFVRQLSQRPGAIVFATSRDPDASPKLKALAEKGNVHPVKLTKQPEAIEEARQAAELVKKVAGRVDFVVANAGTSKVSCQLP